RFLAALLIGVILGLQGLRLRRRRLGAGGLDRGLQGVLLLLELGLQRGRAGVHRIDRALVGDLHLLAGGLRRRRIADGGIDIDHGDAELRLGRSRRGGREEKKRRRRERDGSEKSVFHQNWVPTLKVTILVSSPGEWRSALATSIRKGPKG